MRTPSDITDTFDLVTSWHLSI